MLTLEVHPIRSFDALAEFTASQTIPDPSQQWNVGWREITGNLIQAMRPAISVAGSPSPLPPLTLRCEHTTAEGEIDGVVITLEARTGGMCLASAHYWASAVAEGRGPRFLHADGRAQEAGEYTAAGLWRGIATDLNAGLAALSATFGLVESDGH